MSNFTLCVMRHKIKFKFNERKKQQADSTIYKIQNFPNNNIETQQGKMLMAFE